MQCHRIGIVSYVTVIGSSALKTNASPTDITKTSKSLISLTSGILQKQEQTSGPQRKARERSANELVHICTTRGHRKWDGESLGWGCWKRSLGDISTRKI